MSQDAAIDWHLGLFVAVDQLLRCAYCKCQLDHEQPLADHWGQCDEFDPNSLLEDYNDKSYGRNLLDRSYEKDDITESESAMVTPHARKVQFAETQIEQDFRLPSQNTQETPTQSPSDFPGSIADQENDDASIGEQGVEPGSSDIRITNGNQARGDTQQGVPTAASQATAEPLTVRETGIATNRTVIENPYKKKIKPTLLSSQEERKLRQEYQNEEWRKMIQMCSDRDVELEQFKQAHDERKRKAREGQSHSAGGHSGGRHSGGGFVPGFGRSAQTQMAGYRSQPVREVSRMVSYQQSNTRRAGMTNMQAQRTTSEGPSFNPFGDGNIAGTDDDEPTDGMVANMMTTSILTMQEDSNI